METSRASLGLRPRECAPSRAHDQPWRTTIIFSELGADHPGALVDALYEISNREVNMTRIESARGASSLAATCSSSTWRRRHGPCRRRSHRRASQQGRERPRAGELPHCGITSPNPNLDLPQWGLTRGRPLHFEGISSRFTIRIRAVMAVRVDPGAGKANGKVVPIGGRLHGEVALAPRAWRPGAGPERELRADQRLHDAPRGGAGLEGAGRGVGASRRRSTPSVSSSSGPV